MTQEQLARYVAGLLKNLDGIQITYQDRADIIMLKLIDLGVTIPQDNTKQLPIVNK